MNDREYTYFLVGCALGIGGAVESTSISLLFAGAGLVGLVLLLVTQKPARGEP